MAQIRREKREEVDFAKCEIDCLTLHLHLAGGQVYREVAEVEVSGDVRSAADGSHPCYERAIDQVSRHIPSG